MSEELIKTMGALISSQERLIGLLQNKPSFFDPAIVTYRDSIQDAKELIITNKAILDYISAKREGK